MADDLNSLLDEGPSSQGKIVTNSDRPIDDRKIDIDTQEVGDRPRYRSSSKK